VSRLTPETTTADVLRNSLNRQLDLVFVLDPSEVTVSRIDPLVVSEDRYPPRNVKTNFYKKYKKWGRPSDFSRYVVARTNFIVA